MEVHRPKFIKGFVEEIFVIVISISLAVLAERAVENWIHHKESKESLIRLRAELIRDSVDLSFNYTVHQNAIIGTQKLTDWSYGKIELADDSLSILTSNSLDYSWFEANTSEFESLKSSGKLSYIEDKELVSKIITNYNRYAEYKHFTDRELSLVHQLSEFYRKNTSFITNGFNLDNLAIKQYSFKRESINKRLRGKSEFEGFLQQKQLEDNWMIWLINRDFIRVRELINLIKVE